MKMRADVRACDGLVLLVFTKRTGSVTITLRPAEATELAGLLAEEGKTAAQQKAAGA